MKNNSLRVALLYWVVLYSVSHIPTATTALLQNLALLKGHALTYRCNTSIREDLHCWYFVPLGTQGERIIYNTKGLNGEYVTRAQVDSSTLALTIPSIQLDDAGIYGCKTLRNSTATNEVAQVIVIESNLQICQDDASRLTCEVKYKGNLGPVLEWTKDGSNEPIAINSTSRNEFDASGISRITLTTNSVNSTLTCKLYFKEFTTNFKNITTNTPTYTDRCNSSACCSSSSGATVTISTPHTDDIGMTQETLTAITYSMTIAGGAIIIISIIYISKRIRSVLKIPTSVVDDIHQTHFDSSRSQRLGYEEMQEHELPSEGSYIRLNPTQTTARPLPYVNVVLEESSSETLASRRDRPQQYLNVIIDNAECLVTDDTHQADADSLPQIEEPYTSKRLGYEEMQEEESPSEGASVRLNPSDSTARPLPYINVTLEERGSEALASTNDRPQQYLNVVIENAERLVSDGVTAKMQSYVNVSLQRQPDSQVEEFVAL